MQLGFAFLADAAVATPDGKIGVLGGNFDTLFVAAAPAVHGILALVVNLRVQPAECGHPHQLRVLLWDPDGQQVLPPLELPFAPERQPERTHRAVNVKLIAYIQGLQIPRLGDYAFHILVDDLEMGVVPLYVEELPQPPGPPAALARPIFLMMGWDPYRDLPTARVASGSTAGDPAALASRCTTAAASGRK